MLKVGITGGIGSGKSTVAKIFASLGIPVYEADHRAKVSIENEESVVRRIKDLLGPHAYLSDGSYNKAFVADKVFDNQELLKSLNAIVHPAVGQDFIDWVSQQTSAPYIIKEAAIMSRGSGLDKIIVVTSPLELRISRIQKRDGRSIQEIENIISKQKTEQQYLEISNFEVQNNEVDFILPQVLNIDKALRSQSCNP